MDLDHLLAMTEGAIELSVPAETTLITFGEEHPSLYLLVSGALEIRRDGVVLNRLTEPGNVVGELSLLLGTTASADVVATNPTVVRRIDDAERLFRDVPDFGRHLAVILATRLHRITGWLGDLQRQFADQPGTLGVVPAVLASLMSNDRAELEAGSEREPDSPY